MQAVPTLKANQRLTTPASNRTELVGELGPCWVVVAVICHIAALTVEPHGPVAEIIGAAVKDHRGNAFGQFPAEVFAHRRRLFPTVGDHVGSDLA